MPRQYRLNFAGYNDVEDDDPHRLLRLFWIAYHVLAIPRVIGLRVDPTKNLTDTVFKQIFRVSKRAAQGLLHTLGLEIRDRRGSPLLPIQKLCIFLNHCANNSFQKITGICGHLDNSGSVNRVIREVKALVLAIEHEFVRLPSRAKKAETARYVLEEFGIPNIAYGIDGMLASFNQKPRKLPKGIGLPVAQQFWSRKGDYAINVLILGNHKKEIYALDCDWHGATHDSTIWNHSLFKPILEADRSYMVVGDSGFPISTTLLKPFSLEVGFFKTLYWPNLLSYLCFPTCRSAG